MKGKEERMYLEGMGFAWRVFQREGAEGLEREIKYRGANNVPLNVTSKELTAVARARARDELMFVATAMAETLSKDLKLPPSVLKEFLSGFNEKVELFRYDHEAFENAMSELDRNFAMQNMCKRFLREGKEDGEN